MGNKMIEILQIAVLGLFLKPLTKMLGDEYFKLNDKLFFIGVYGGLFSVTMGNIFGGMVWVVSVLISGLIITSTYFVFMIKE